MTYRLSRQVCAASPISHYAITECIIPPHLTATKIQERLKKKSCVINYEKTEILEYPIPKGSRVFTLDSVNPNKVSAIFMNKYIKNIKIYVAYLHYIYRTSQFVVFLYSFHQNGKYTYELIDISTYRLIIRHNSIRYIGTFTSNPLQFCRRFEIKEESVNEESVNESESGFQSRKRPVVIGLGSSKDKGGPFKGKKRRFRPTRVTNRPIYGQYRETSSSEMYDNRAGYETDVEWEDEEEKGSYRSRYYRSESSRPESSATSNVTMGKSNLDHSDPNPDPEFKSYGTAADKDKKYCYIR